MEQHPIPRQITTFEFKLIGFMTLKQFLFLLVFFPSGFVVFRVFPIPVVNIVLGILVAALGIALAFLPVNERPLDVWIKNLIKRLNSPTQFTFHKQNTPLYFLENLYFMSDPHKIISHVESREKLAEYLEKTQPKRPSTAKKTQIQSLLKTPTAQIRTQVAPVQPTPVQPVVAQPVASIPTPPSPVVPEVQEPLILSQPVQPVQSLDPIQNLQTSDRMSAPVMEAASIIQAPVIEPQVTHPPEPVVPVAPPAVQVQAPVVLAPVAKSVQHPYLTGIVKNTRKIPLPGVLVYIKNEQSAPLRLLKTNPHGVFATYNPLPDGEYAFEIKDPNGGYNFDTMKLHIPNVDNKPYEFYSKEMI